FENLDLVLEKDYWIGLTVQLGKLSAQEVANIVEKHGSERFIVNSDSGYGNEFVTAVAEVAKVVAEEAERICLKNAEKFLGV
ncbi:MAG: deoxyribonuclease, partial [Archaeoglobaceae archaeon]